MTELLAIILAAGEGTRMRSALPKVLHEVGGLAMVGHVVRAAQAAGAGAIAAVIGPGHEPVARQVRALAPGASLSTQNERRGTAHAVLQAEAALARAAGNVLVLYGDTPLVSAATLAGISARLDSGADIVVVGFRPEDPTGYGRLITRGENLLAIREHRDASADERAIGLCNSGIMGFRADTLRGVLGRIGNANAKGEYYLTDAVEIANGDGRRIDVVEAGEGEVIGVDDRAKLARAEAQFQQLRREDFLAAGVTMKDPSSVYFSWDTEIGGDVVIEPGVFFGPGVRVGAGAVIHAFCHIEGATIGAGASVGPFARLRPEAVLAEGAKVGNFVEIKKADIGRGAKVSHLTYIGDAEVGAGANIGAGTVTCNYDGVNKHTTRIGEGAFVGSNSSLVAPVSIGAGAYVGSGSVITEDVPDDALALGRARQEVRPGRATAIRARAEALKAARKAAVSKVSGD